jgi:hypothetical protein
MRKYLAYIILVLLLSGACEKDDICVDITTPRLVIKFKNQTDSTALMVENLTVWPENKDSIYVGVSLDSILIPLNPYDNSTLYKFASGDFIDEIRITYNTNDVYISRSCGYIAHFTNLITPVVTSQWIAGVSIDNSTIDNEETAHISIFH